MTFKENVPDVRNSKSIDIIDELTKFGIEVLACDPCADPHEVRREYGVDLVDPAAAGPVDAVILAVAHREYVSGGWALVRALADPRGAAALDVKGALPRAGAPAHIRLWRP
jgi:UDP-N-acetyl-D-galactosamine dehydrogenase